MNEEEKRDKGLAATVRGSMFEREVYDILRLRGFNIEQDLRSDGFRADFVVSKGQGYFRQFYLIEAKDHDRPIGNGEVLKLGGAVNALRNTYPRLIGLLISKGKFSTDAKKAAQSQNDVEILTFDELLNDLVDFDSYLRVYIQEYRAKRIYDLFVDPSFRIGSSTGGSERSSLTSWLVEWARGKKVGVGNHLILLGEYGLGKTVVAERLVYRIATAIIEEGISGLPLPIIIQLRRFSEALKSLRDFTTSHLVNELGIELNYPIFLKLLRAGRILLILDGFDEMAMRVDEEARDHNFIVLQSLCPRNSRVIITGRPEYFPSEEHMTALISSSRKLNPSVQAILSDLEELPTFEKLHLELFDSKRIEQFLLLCEKRKEKEFPGASIVAEQIRTTYDLQNLASRPVLLDLIVMTLPELMAQERAITASGLYQLYTDYWIKREKQKGRRLIPSRIKKRFMYELSWKMITKKQFSVHFTELPLDILDFFNPDSEADWERYDHDIRACSYLHRDEQGNYSFAHKTFMEFFCASRIFSELTNGLSNPFVEVSIPSEIMAFFCEMDGESIPETLSNWVYFDSESYIFRQNVQRYLSRIPVLAAIVVYCKCLAYFPGDEANSILRLLRRRLDHVTSGDRWVLAGRLYEIGQQGDLKVSKAVHRLESIVNIHMLLVEVYARHLKEERSLEEVCREIGAPRILKGEQIRQLIQLEVAIRRTMGKRGFRDLIEKPEIDIADKLLKDIENATQASPRLVKDLLKTFDISSDKLLPFFKGLRLRKLNRITVKNVLKEKDVAFLAREIGLPTGSTAEVMLKTRLSRDDLRSHFKTLTEREQDFSVDDLRKVAGMSKENFRVYFSIFSAAARLAGIV